MISKSLDRHDEKLLSCRRMVISLGDYSSSSNSSIPIQRYVQGGYWRKQFRRARGLPLIRETYDARRLATILPPLSFDEALEVTKLYSVTGQLGRERSLITQRPFRAPHHTVSDAGLIGGGTIPRPGEISLAHHGVLFLDELPEFTRAVLEVMRQPLEEGHVTTARAAASLTYPAYCIFCATMNPCPCGR